MMSLGADLRRGLARAVRPETRWPLQAVAKRDLHRYFNNPTGYVFITLFILLSAVAAFWRPRFFLNSLANLDQLNDVFPYLMLFFVPALCMGLWADERKLGTDELLLTLPATEAGLVLGKYAAAAAIYAVALAVSVSHAFVLAWLGNPDWGLLAANYCGFLLLGGALIPVAMLASLMTSNVTIAFILGVLFAAVPIAIGEAGTTISTTLGRMMTPFSVSPYFSDFTFGIVSLNGVAYFAGVAIFFAYLNVMVLQGRRWASDRRARMRRRIHGGLRAAAIAVIIASAVVLAGQSRTRLDLTADHLFSLSDPTRALIAAMPSDRPVFIQAFISPEMPGPLVQTRENLLGLLRELEGRAAGRITVAVQDTEPFSAQARLARERYNISPRRVTDPSTGQVTDDVYLGVALTSGVDEQVIPFLERGLSTEYELARAIRVVSHASRKRIGIIDADVKMLGGIDYRTNQPRPVWLAVQDLRIQYDIVEVTPAGAADANVDALIIVLPSLMTQTDLDLAMTPVKRGIPTLMLVDPLPMIDMRLAPAADLANQIDPFRPRASSRLVFGDIRSALAEFGINWVPARVVWDGFNPHPDLAELPQETVFVSDGNGNPRAFNRATPVTARLQEVLLLYPGYLIPTEQRGDVTFQPLLEAGTVSGASSFFDLVTPTPNGMALNPSVARETSATRYVLAARTRSARPMIQAPGVRPLDLITIADIDFISDAFFNIRATAQSTANFDNISFFSNAIDMLAGDESFIALRSRAGRHRTLERLEAQTRTFMDRRARDEQQAQQQAQSALEEARGRLKKRVDEVAARTDLDDQAKQIMVRNLEETENRQLRVLEVNITQARDTKIRESRETIESDIRRIRNRIRTLAVLLPPLPVLLAGAILFARKTRREREVARATGRIREEVA